MATIIRQGNLKLLDPEVQVMCSACKSVIRYKRSEGTPSQDPRDQGLYVFKCLCCAHENYKQV